MLEAEAVQQIAKAGHVEELEALRVRLLGKKGKISRVLGAMAKLSSHERPLIGQRANILKIQVQQKLRERLEVVKAIRVAECLASETLDVTAPPSGIPVGHRHPLVTTTEEILDLFVGLGYRIVDGPEIESDYYNFTALNIPSDHPARDMQDTFYLPNGQLLRTHPSPVQIRHLEQNPPPVVAHLPRVET